MESLTGWMWNRRGRKLRDLYVIHPPWNYGLVTSSVRSLKKSNGLTNPICLATGIPKNEVTQMGHNKADNLISTTDAKGNTYQFTYDLLNHKTSMVYPNGTKDQMGFDAVGNMTTFVTRARQVCTDTVFTKQDSVRTRSLVF